MSLFTGGEDVSPVGKWPFMASQQVEGIGGQYTHSCGASLIGEDYLVTAVHCVDGLAM